MLENLGNLGDFVSGIGVVATLIYLAVQIRQNSRSVKASAAQSIIQSLAEAYNVTASSPELCHIILVGTKDVESLTDQQKAQLYMWLTSWFRLVEQAYLHYKLGNIPKSTWTGQLAHLESTLATPSMIEFWDARKSVYSEEFRSFVDSLDVRHATTSNEMFSEFESADRGTDG
jgi:hypothetical protein